MNHFSRSELTTSETSKRLQLPNEPNAEQWNALCSLRDNVLNPLREKLALPIHINSAFRSKEVNSATPGSSKTSQHMLGEAADLESFGYDNMKLAAMIISAQLPFDELILEFYKAGDVNSGWIHVSHTIRRPNKGTIMSSFKKPDGRTGFRSGLVAISSP